MTRHVTTSLMPVSGVNDIMTAEIYGQLALPCTKEDILAHLFREWPKNGNKFYEGRSVN